MMRTIGRRCAGLLVALVAGCAAPGNPYYDRAKAHHTPTGFRNNYIEVLGNDRLSFWKWQWQRFASEIGRAHV